MDSIKYNAKGHSVEFSKRALTIDGKVYQYTGISQIKHSAAYKAYLFRYNNEWVKLFYEEPHGKVIATLFKRIQAMNDKRATQARATQSIDTEAIKAALESSDEKKQEEPKAEEKPEEPKAEEKPAEPKAEEKPAEPEAKAAEPVAEEKPAEHKVEEKPEEPKVEEKPGETKPVEEPKPEEPKAEELHQNLLQVLLYM